MSIIELMIFSAIRNQKGQSLVEIVIALAIGAIVIGAAAAAVVVVLRSGITTQRQQSGTILAQDVAEKVRTFAAADWQNIYGLTKGSSTTYYFNASSTELFTIKGKEGVIDNDIRDNLSAYWNLDEATSTTVYDFSGHQNDGVFVNTPTRATSSCQAGYCLSFDGVDDRVNIPAPLTNFPTSTITVSAWVKVSNHVDWYDYVRNNWAGTAGAWLLYSDSSGNARFGVIDDALAQHNASGCSTNFTVDNWHMITGTYDGSTVRVYLDGVQCATTNSLSGQSLYTGGAIQFGEWGSTGATTHRMDEVRVYNRALTATEIQNLYNSNIFRRYFYVEDVCRTNDSNYSLAGVTPCDAGEVEDPTTEQVTIITEWDSARGNVEQFSLVEFVTRWKNRIFRQTDWTGGNVGETVITEPSNTYSSSSGVSTSTGFIKIEGL